MADDRAGPASTNDLLSSKPFGDPVYAYLLAPSLDPRFTLRWIHDCDAMTSATNI